MKRAVVAPVLFAAARAFAQDALPPQDPPPAPTEQPAPAETPRKEEPLHAKDVGSAIASPFKRVFERMREQEAAEKKKRKPVDELSAADVANAPLPGEESGRTDDGDHDSVLRDIGQGVLFLPRMVLETTFAPVRGSLWAYDHYSLGKRAKRVAFDDTFTYGFYPTLIINSDYGATIGARFVHRNLFGAHEKFAARGGVGGEFNTVVSGVFKTGERLGNTASMELFGEFERRPRDPFYGIGNMDGAVETRHRQQLKRVTTTLDILSAANFHTRIAGALTDLNYGVASEGPAIDVMYDSSMLTGWTGTRNLYGELELRYDSRRIEQTLESKGMLVSAFTGRIHQLEAGHDYWRYGGEGIHFQSLGMGRTLVSRLHLESVTGALNDVAFTQLPQLGGKTFLRGYPADRFRDRTALVGSAEYMWDLSAWMLASVFVDAGRVYSDITAVNPDDLRLGYGVALQIVDKRSFLAGVSAASSIDGGLFLNLVLDPVYEPSARVKQK
jgi:hypothetical protein